MYIKKNFDLNEFPGINYAVSRLFLVKSFTGELAFHKSVGGSASIDLLC